jgi:hypothetical protein
MKITQILSEANVAAKIKDPKTIKMLGIAMRHDGTLPLTPLAALGDKPTDEQIVKLWSDLLDKSLSSTDYGNISADGKFDEWITRLYMNGVLDYEDVNGEVGDALGAWKALSIRGKLRPEHQDFNKFKNLRQIQSIIQSRAYSDELNRIKNAEMIEKHKREREEVILFDDERYLVMIPMNYGSCYTFNNSAGFNASFCTGSSSGLRWFNNYSKDGPIISVVDKNNFEDVNGKWQIHAPTSQMNNGDQTISYSSGDKKFAELFPGLLKNITSAMSLKAEQIRQASKHIVPGGYDVQSAVSELKTTFPVSYATSEAKKADAGNNSVNDQDGPGTYLVTQLASGRSARIEGENRADIVRQLTARYPDSSEADYRIEKQD